MMAGDTPAYRHRPTHRCWSMAIIWYWHRARGDVDIMVSLRREQQPAFIATMRGPRHAATTPRIARLLLSLRGVAMVRT
jgi:DUF1365 family protein